MNAAQDRIMRRLSDVDLSRYRAQADALVALHASNKKRRPKCVECETSWPCRTYRILGKP